MSFWGMVDPEPEDPLKMCRALLQDSPSPSGCSAKHILIIPITLVLINRILILTIPFLILIVIHLINICYFLTILLTL